jgi:hypothetical protein
MMHTKHLWKLGLVLSLVAGCKKAAPPAADAGAGGAPVTATDAAAKVTDAAAKAPKDAAADAVAKDAAAKDAAVAAAAGKLPEAFVAFEAMLLPLVREAESDARSKKTCKDLEKLRIAGRAVQRSQPAGVNATAWEEASVEMRGAFEGLGATCTDDPPNDTPDLEVVHQSYQKLVALLPR